MALRLRRGTNAERQLITPAEGELIYTTDTKQLFVGDGSTIGGVLVTIGGASLSSLSDVALGSLDNGDVLTWVESLNTWLALPLTAPELIQGASYSINIIDPNTNEFIVDAESGNVNANNISATSIVADGIFSQDINGTFNGRILGDDSTIILDSFGSNVNANNISATSIFADTFNGTFFGPLEGDVYGSVFGDDSTVLVDGVTNTVGTNFLKLSSNNLISSGLEFNIRHENPTVTSVMYLYSPEAGINVRQVSSTNGNESAGTEFRVHRGTFDNPLAIVPGDVIGIPSLSSAFDGTDYVFSSIIAHLADPDETISTGNVPGTISLFTYSNGDITNPKGVTINSKGFVGVNNGDNTIAAELDIYGIARLEPQAAPPATLVEGMIAVADRINWDPAAKGAGNSYPAYYDGTAWVAMT